MDGEEVGSDSGGGADGAGNGVGNVVEFQIEKDGVAAMTELVDESVACGEVELEAHFEPGAGAFELSGEGEGGGGAGVVESHDEAGVHTSMVP
jgi:hypothetical protein